MFKKIDKLRNHLPRSHQNAPWLLWLDKYSYKWYRDFDDKHQKNKYLQKQLPAAKTSALILTADLARPEQMAEACKNKLAFIDRLKNFFGDRLIIVELVNDSRLLLHLGRSNVLENVGLYAERITGLPVIPGTSLKGALSTWAFWEENEKSGTLYQGNEDKFIKKRANLKLAKEIFGDDSKDGSTHSGEIVFVGGFPAAPPKIGIDIVNPHYEANGEEKETLTPNTFLCVEPGTIWKFVFFVRPGVENYKGLLNQTEKWLIDCLTQIGIGAKTAAGYGRFREANENDKRNLEQFWKNIKNQEVRPTGTGATPKPPPLPPPTVDLSGDYPNEQTFNNLVIKNLEPSKFESLKKEIEKLKKPENSKWLQMLKEHLKINKKICRNLKEKEWFPKEWLQ
ncbi:MAG: type III-B CRISPR module RAMP protein Cmr6 [Verrucomicrobiia bacterium]